MTAAINNDSASIDLCSLPSLNVSSEATVSKSQGRKWSYVAAGLAVGAISLVATIALILLFVPQVLAMLPIVFSASALLGTQIGLGVTVASATTIMVALFLMSRPNRNPKSETSQLAAEAAAKAAAKAAVEAAAEAVAKAAAKAAVEAADQLNT